MLFICGRREVIEVGELLHNWYLRLQSEHNICGVYVVRLRAGRTL